MVLSAVCWAIFGLCCCLHYSKQLPLLFLQDSNNHVAYELLGLVGDSLSGLKDKVFENEGMQDDTMTGVCTIRLFPLI